MKKKLFCTLFAITIAVTGIGNSVKAQAMELPVELFSEEYYEKVVRVSELYPQIIQQYKETVEIQTRSQGDEIESLYDDNYAGIYLDEQGVLNIMLKEIPATTQMTSFSQKASNNQDIIQYQQAKYSYNFLHDVFDVLNSNMTDFDITSVGISQKNNRVEIGVKDESIIESIKDFLKAQELYQDEAISFQVESSHATSSYEDYAMAGTQIWYNHGFLWLKKSYGTIGANVVDNDTGKKGVLTNAHVAVANKTMKHANGTVGERSKGWYGGTIDAAFVPFSKSHWVVTDYATYGDQSVIHGNIKEGNENHIVEGYPTVKFGYTTGRTTGTITHVEYSTNFVYGDDSTSTLVSNVFRYSNSSLGGDSGGPVYYTTGTKGSLYLIGLNYAGPADTTNYTYGVGCRITNVLSQLNLTLITSQNFQDYM